MDVNRSWTAKSFVPSAEILNAVAGVGAVDVGACINLLDVRDSIPSPSLGTYVHDFGKRLSETEIGLDSEYLTKEIGVEQSKKMSRSEISRLGGVAAQASGNAYQWNEKEAAEAGRLGGREVLNKYGPEHFSKIGKLGAAKRRENQKKRGGKY